MLYRGSLKAPSAPHHIFGVAATLLFAVITIISATAAYFNGALTLEIAQAYVLLAILTFVLSVTAAWVASMMGRHQKENHNEQT